MDAIVSGRVSSRSSTLKGTPNISDASEFSAGTIIMTTKKIFHQKSKRATPDAIEEEYSIASLLVGLATGGKDTNLTSPVDSFEPFTSSSRKSHMSHSPLSLGHIPVLRTQSRVAHGNTLVSLEKGSSRARSQSVEVSSTTHFDMTVFRPRSDSAFCQINQIGIYPQAIRKMKIERYREKRKHRQWNKTVKYDVRKNFADSRVRIKGRFVRKENRPFISDRSGSIIINTTEEDEEEEEDCIIISNTSEEEEK